MCGIIGYNGKGNVKGILIDGLKALEYRGYDSAGIALSSINDKEIIKSVGRVAKLEERVKMNLNLLLSLELLILDGLLMVLQHLIMLILIQMEK